MTAIKNGSPKVILEGTHDVSGRAVPPEPLEVPIHLPQFFSFGERGPLTNQMGSIADLKRVFGAKTFMTRSEFATHSTPFINKIGGAGNNIMFKRIVAADAKASTATIWVIMTEADLPVYTRNDEGMYILDDGGLPIPLDGVTVEGYTVRWEIRTGVTHELGQAVGQEGTAGDKKTYTFPVLDLAASHVGGYGDNLAFRFSVPTVTSNTAPDLDLIESEAAMICRLQFLERIDELASPSPVVNLNNERFVDFTLKEDVVDKYDIEKYIDEAVVPSYQSIDDPSLSPVYAPVGGVHFYRANFVKLAGLIRAAETALDATDPDGAIHTEDLSVEQMNIFTGKTVEGVPFSSIALDRSEGSAMLSERSTHYLGGGSNGDMSRAVHDTLVREIMLNGWEDPSDPLDDMAKNPLSCIWDTGFGMDAKFSLCEALGWRPDVVVILSTHVDGQASLNWAEEESVANALRTYAAGYPESQVHGTPCCRAAVVAGTGLLTDGTFKRPVPLSLDLAEKIAAYMGAGNGIMKTGKAFDVSPNNHISILRDVTGTYKTNRQRQKDWDAGMIWAATYDRRSNFYPQFQTAYPDDTSVLNSLITVFIVASIQKVCASVWRDLSGNSTLNNAQLIEQSDKLIRERTSGRFDNRVVIVPETYFTAADEARGFSWSCNVHMYAKNMKTVGSFTVVGHRYEELAAA